MTKKQNRYLALIVLGYVFLAVIYALSTPPLEASDEYKHYPVVQFVQTKRAFPILDPEDPGRWLQEAAQPPLYYVLMAAATAWIDTSDLPELHKVNHHAFVGDPNQIDNKNLIIHQPEQETFPWDGSVLAIYIIRFVSILLGVGTLLVTVRLGTLLFYPTIGLLAAALTAFNPMFIFVSAAVNNDALAILLGNLALYLLVRIWRDAPDPLERWSRYALLGLVLGLGMVTKLSLAGLLLLSGLALAWLSWRRKDWRVFFFGGSMVLLVALVLSVPWLIRNIHLYDDPTALNVFVAVQGTRDSAITIQDWIGEFGTFYRSFWGLFGGVNVAAPELLYWLYNLVAMVGVVGFVLWLWRSWKSRKTGDLKPSEIDPETFSGNHSRTDEAEDTDVSHQPSLENPADDYEPSDLVGSGLWLLLAWTGILFILLVRWNIVSPAFQGRLIFPALGALNVIWAAGLLAWVSPSRKARAGATIAGLFFAAAMTLPWIAIRPAYAYPEPLLSVPEEARFGPFQFAADGGKIQLSGVEIAPDQDDVAGKDPLMLILYWEAISPVRDDYLSSIHVLGRDLISEGQVNRYPASGMIPTSQWKPGQIWRDEYHIYVDEDAKTPTRLLVKASLFDTAMHRDLNIFGPDGEPVELLIVADARLGSRPDEKVEPPVSLDVPMNDGFHFLGYGAEPDPVYPSENLNLDLYWQATGVPSLDYTVFVHLLDANDELLATADGPPVFGDYPTSLWRERDQIVDEHVMALPADLAPGLYRLSVGLYDPKSLTRVGLLDGSGDAISWPVEIHSR